MNEKKIKKKEILIVKISTRWPFLLSHSPSFVSACKKKIARMAREKLFSHTSECTNILN
jgi:hypothetical protein